MTRPTKALAWRTRRETSGLTLSEAARRAGLNKGVLSMIETGRMVPTPAEAEAILAVLALYEKEGA